MATEPDRRERDLFTAALERFDEERDDFLRAACEDAPELELRLQRLLAAHRRAESTVTRDRGCDPAAIEYPERIGPYRLLERIGEGGMGVVYVAEQAEPVRRRVALKLIKAGMDTREVIARFHTERQALALMNHPNIARILEAGATEWGRPYFVMEYVPGMPLLEYCDRQRLAVRERLRLFTQVCQAVQHAHQKGVIHRDLKPSNILIQEEDGQSIPKVIDFGVAKAVGQRLSELTIHTRLGGFIGTPEYVSPEQAQTTGLDVDTRADVYSLGAVLYELLTGARPFDFRDLGLAEIQTLLFEKDPPPPSTVALGDGERDRSRADSRRTDPAELARTLHHDLDWIVLKALEKDRTRRFPSASELAADLERYLDGHPVTAGPPGAGYRLRRFVRRHRPWIAAAGLFVLLLVGGILGTSLGLLQARREAERARIQTAIAREINTFLNDDLLAAVTPERQGIEVSMREVLDRASQRIEGRFDDQPLVEAALRLTIGNTYEELGVYAAAEPHFQRAVELRRRVQGPQAAETLEALYQLGSLYQLQARHDEAEEILLGVLETRRQLWGDDDPRTLSILGSVAILYEAMGRLGEAESLYVDCVAARERLSGRDDPGTLNVLQNLAILYQHMGRWDEAEQLQLESHRGFQRHYGDDGASTLNSLINLSALYLRQERFPEAQEVLERGLAPMRRVMGDEHPQTLMMINNLGYLYSQQGRFDEAEPLLLESLEAKRRILGEEHRSTLEAIDSLIDLYRNMGVRSQLASWTAEYFRIRRSLAERPSATPKDQSLFANLLLTIDSVKLRDPATALRYARAANEATEGRDGRMLEILAEAYFQTGDAERAAETVRRALELSTGGPSAFRESLEQALARYLAPRER